MTQKNTSVFLTLAILTLASVGLVVNYSYKAFSTSAIERMVEDHARAWETGDEKLLSELLHEEVVFAYPGRRLNKEETLADLAYFRDNYSDTKVYINRVIVDGNHLAVEWQFATTKKETGKREVVSDAIIGEVKDGKFIVWKEYLDGRVKGLQAEGKLYLEEGEEPYPWPLKIDPAAPSATQTTKTPANGNTKPESHPFLNSAQEGALKAIGIDPKSIPTSITPAQEQCFIEKLGAARVEEMKNGAVPTAGDVFNAGFCL
jgi:ketosteroid isomerase-like protein